ncbi:serine-rich adhesin for platelets-like [Anoplopoma fimbria]|uniref:serine-rich adhesin for platelets-like n=1 Tax=Anoplopoma fimbria TaxID=229290 RepID=UPI0023EB3645|nr:serine-rich adhesin for platelets-like [Anoplopoma fimbria]
MKGLLFLLICIEILGALYGALNISTTAVSTSSHATSDSISVASSLKAVPMVSSRPSTPPSPHKQSITSTTTTRATSTRATSTRATSTSTPINMFNMKECRPVFIVAGGLIIACTILLISTLLLIYKVCRMSRRIKTLSNDNDLISTSEYWMETAKKSKGASETEAKETTVLMADINQTQEAVENSGTKDEAVKVNEDEQTGEEDKKEVGDTAKSEEASTTPVTAVDNAASSEPQEEDSDTQSVEAEAAPSSKGTEEPKEEV